MPTIEATRDAGVALLAGLVVFLALYPASGQDSIPPKQWGFFGNSVPSPEPLISVVAGGATFVIVAVIIVARSSRPRQLSVGRESTT